LHGNELESLGKELLAQPSEVIQRMKKIVAQLIFGETGNLRRLTPVSVIAAPRSFSDAGFRLL
jgi:hypothetical protein